MDNYFPESERQPIDEEEARQERRSLGFYYMGILQGLLLGIGGNLLVAHFMEVLQDIVSAEYWFVTNLAGLVIGLIIVLWMSWRLFIKAGKGFYGSSYEEALKHRIKRKLRLFWYKLKYFLKHRRLPSGYPAR